MTKKFNKNKYIQDFPDEGYFNWKVVRIQNTNTNFDGWEVIGVLLHDNRFMIKGTRFEKDEFVIIEEDPMGLEQIEYEEK